MNQPNTIEVPSSAVTVREVDHTAPNAQDAKAAAIASLTMEAYRKASELRLTPEEANALCEEFDDECFMTGAAGKENLIYLEHCHLRIRLNKVVGPGQWSIIPRQRWGEDFTTFKGAKGVRVYVEGMLVVRGCFVAEAIGDMSYYPSNESQNYGDAVEGAKTEVLRRCCKEMGIGLQAWDKKWIDGWWKRKREAEKPVKPTVTTQKPSQEPSNPPAPLYIDPLQPKAPTTKDDRYQAKCRMQLLNKLQASVGGANRQLFKHFCASKLWLKADQELELLDFKHVPKSPDEFASLIEEFHKFDMQQQAANPEIVP